jgi:hypothetical protein
MYQLYRPVDDAEVDEIPPHDFGVSRVIFDQENNDGFTFHVGCFHLFGDWLIERVHGGFSAFISGKYFRMPSGPGPGVNLAPACAASSSAIRT